MARVCYSAPVKAFADGERSNRIIWYRVPDTREFYEGEHTFSPRVDDMFQPSGEEYELTGRIPNPRRYYSGRDIWHKLGVAVDGDEQDFMGLSLESKYIVNGNAPQDPCGVPPVLVHLLRVGQFISTIPPKIRLVEERLRLGQFVALQDYPPPPYVTGLRVGQRHPIKGGAAAFHGEALAIADDLGGGLHHKHKQPAALLLGDVTLAAQDGPAVEGLLLGVALGRASLVRPFWNEGLLLGLHVNVEPQESELIEVGLMIAERSIIPPSSPWVFDHGLKIGERAFIKPPQEPPLYLHGLKIGHTVDVDELVNPGGSCETAPTVPFRQTFGATIDTMESQWWKLAAFEDVQHYLKLTIVEGFVGDVFVWAGPDCSFLELLATINGNGDCETWVAPVGQIVVVAVWGHMSGGGVYQLEWDTGDCPT